MGLGWSAKFSIIRYDAKFTVDSKADHSA